MKNKPPLLSIVPYFLRISSTKTINFKLQFLIVFLLTFALIPLAEASVFYKFDVIAKTGDANLTGMGNAPSINDKGIVAFTGQISGGESVFIGDGSALPTNITPGFISSTRSFGSAVQINNAKKVVARDRLSGSPIKTLVRIWDASTLGFTTIVRGGGSSDPYDSVLTHSSINNNSIQLEDIAASGGNDDGTCDLGETCIDQVVFSSFTGISDFLATPQLTPINISDSGSYNNISLSVPLRPQIADNGRIIVRSGNLSTDSIELYDYALTNSITIADASMGFTALGQSPGISDDGRIVVFYGDLNATGAAALNTTSGPGIFARINQFCVTSGINGILDSATEGDDENSDVGILSGPNGICETNKTGDDRLHIPTGSSSFSPIQRIAGLANGVLDPGETFNDTNSNGKYDAGEPDVGLFTSFVPDARVSVNSTGTVVYMANDGVGDKGIYTTQLDFISVNPFNPSPFSVNTTPSLIAKKGDVISGIGTIQDIAIHDPLNNHDRQNTSSNRENIAFWLLTVDNKQAIVRATPLCNGSDYSEPSQNPYIHQYDAGESLSLPISSVSAGSKKGGNACGPSSFTMLINSYKLSNAQAKRLQLFSSTDFSPGAKVSVYGKTMASQPADNVNNTFSWSKALTYVKSELAYLDAKAFDLTHPSTPRTVNDLKAFIDDNLSIGSPVLVSTTFSSKARTSSNPFSGGHVILFIGRTLTGDYIVKDPAGDYLAGASSANEHYGLDANGKVKSCGAYVVYPKEKVKENLAKRSNSTLKKFTNSVTLAEATTTNLDDAAPRPALAVPPSASVDPDGFLIIGRFTGSTTRPYQLWIEDSSGKRTGWLPTGEKIFEIPDSYADVDPILPSNPDASDEDLVDATSWPFMVSVNNAEDSLKVFVYGNQDTDFSLEVVRYQNGKMTSSIASGAVIAGETKQINMSTPSPLITVPNVVGQTQANAEASITALGLVANVTTASSSTVTLGTVISQSPAASIQIAVGSTVDLVVSSGPALVAVPDVVGQPQTNAEASIMALGLIANVTTASSSTVPSGTVISQSPINGTEVASGSAVDLVVSSGTEPAPGDLNSDGVVNCFDLAIVKAAFGKRTGQTGFDARADVNNDGVVDVRDLSYVSRLLPTGTKCS